MNICIIQPVLASYRHRFFNEVSLSANRLTIITGPTPSEFGSVREAKYFHIEKNIMSIGPIRIFIFNYLYFLRSNDVIVHFADFKYFSTWLLLLLGRFFNCKILLHGQGGYKKKSSLSNFVYNISLRLCDKYICYTEYSRDSILKKINKNLEKKVLVLENSLMVDNFGSCHKAHSKDILFIGRLREGCGLDLLLEAASSLDIKVNIIGPGEQTYIDKLKFEYNQIAKFFGAIYDNNLIKKIACDCFVGVYPGDAGLSVVQYMAYGLPIIVHSEIKNHMGPEPSYVIDGCNGLLFKRNDINSLVSNLSILRNDIQLRNALSTNSINTYVALNNPNMAERFQQILEQL